MSGGEEPTLRSAAPSPEAAAPEPTASEAAGPEADVLELGSPRHARRLPQPRRWPGLAARAAGRATRAVGRWAGRPSGRLVLPGLLIAFLLALTGAAGAYLVPSAAGPPPAPAPSASAGGTPTAEPPTVPPENPPPLTVGPGDPMPANPSGREASKLAAWAQPLAVRTQIPPVALEAYGYAEWVLSQTQPSCHVKWTTLAAIGKVESNHGSTGTATLTADGRAYPPIIGPALDGQAGRKLVRDTDSAALDNDPTYDRAIGPMQFLPSTWRAWGIDADNSGGAPDPHDVDDSSLAAAKYLCSGGRDLATADGWWDAVLSYNDVQTYAQDVFRAATAYGLASRNTP